MQSDRGIKRKRFSCDRYSIRFVFSTVLLVWAAPNLLAQQDKVIGENDAVPQQPSTDSDRVEPASLPTETASDPSVHREADESLSNDPTDASGKDAPVDFGAMDAPQLKTSVSKTTPKETKPADPSVARESKKGQSTEGGAPKARIGAQLTIWPSFSIPFGKFDGEHDISHIRGLGYYEVVLVGYKILPEFLLGLQITMLRGAPGDAIDEVCEDGDSFCISSGIGVGAQAQAHLMPSRFVNPWFGYALGISYLSTVDGFFAGDTSFSAPSFDFAQISAGADFRFNRAFGFGPFIGFGAGVYFHQIQMEQGQDEPNSNEIEDQALHFQLDIGVRFVFTP